MTRKKKKKKKKKLFPLALPGQFCDNLPLGPAAVFGLEM